MPTTANTINYYVAADGTLRDGQQGSISQQPRINYGTEYSVTLTFPASTIAEGDQLQVALNRTRTFFSSASATGDAPVAAVAKHDVTAAEADAQAVTLTLSTNTRAMIDQVNGIDHPVRGFFGVHILRGQSFVTLAVADALMMSLESGPDAISPSLPVVDYPTRQEMNDAVEAAKNSASAAKTSEDNADASASAAERDAQAAAGSATEAAGSATQAGQAATAATTAKNAAETAQGKAEAAQGKAEQAQAKAEQAQGAAETAQTAAETAQGKAEDAQEAAQTAQGLAEDAQDAAQTACDAAVVAKGAAETAEANAAKIAEGSDADVAPLGLEHSAKAWAQVASERMTVVTIPPSTTSYTLQDNKHYQQVPDAVPTYTLPTATMDGLVHEITVLVDFLHVTSCSFLDAGGVPVTLQSAISPQIGEAYIFRCYWYDKWRVVPMKIRNAATVSSATGVVEVTDAVAGDALALKMVAPRSVVVNQLSNSRTAYGWKADETVSSSDFYLNGEYTITVDRTFNKVKRIINIGFNDIYVSGHIYLLYAEIINQSEYIARFGLKENISGNTTLLATPDVKSSTWTSIYIKGEVSSSESVCLVLFTNNAAPAGTTVKFRNMMCVDLTAYFNGDTTLINSIASWDDLVAYDPRFANYVEYNTGEVKGVVPAVSVNNGTAIASPNELFAVGTAADEYEVVSGVTTHKMASVDLGTLNYTYSGTRFRSVVPGIKQVNNGYGYCDRYVRVTEAYVTDKCVLFFGQYVYIYDSAYTNATAFKAALSGVMLYYELADPTISSSTPTQISLQAGSNTIQQTDGGRTLAELAMTYEYLPTA